VGSADGSAGVPLCHNGRVERLDHRVGSALNGLQRDAGLDLLSVVLQVLVVAVRVGAAAVALCLGPGGVELGGVLAARAGQSPGEKVQLLDQVGHRREPHCRLCQVIGAPQRGEGLIDNERREHLGAERRSCDQVLQERVVAVPFSWRRCLGPDHEGCRTPDLVGDLDHLHERGIPQKHIERRDGRNGGREGRGQDVGALRVVVGEPPGESRRWAAATPEPGAVVPQIQRVVLRGVVCGGPREESLKLRRIAHVHLAEVLEHGRTDDLCVRVSGAVLCSAQRG